MKLPLGWVRVEAGRYVNEALCVAVCFETPLSVPLVCGGGGGWWCYPADGLPYGPEPTMRRAMALAEANAKERR